MGARTKGAGARRVTLAQVAERAGVSVATASKVMNGRAAVKQSTRIAVADAAQELGYEQRRRAGEGRRTLCLHLESVDSPYVMGVLAGAEKAARRAGVDLVITSGEGAGLSRAWMTGVASAGVEGVIAVVAPIGPRQVRWSRSLSLPLLVIDPILEDLGVEDVLTVTSTNWEGGAEATRHLLELGHRRIGILAGPPGSVPGQQRLQGYRSAFADAGLEVDEELVVHGDFNIESGEATAGALLDLPEPPTAIFACSDPSASGALRAARARGTSVPDQLSVIGFDDTMITRWTHPQLTAVRQPLFSMGQVAVERLLALAADPEAFSHPFKLETSLVVRESTAPPRA